MAASRVACASFNLGTNTTISITSDKSSYVHTLDFSFNGLTGNIVTRTTSKTYVWTMNNSLVNSFYSKIPNTTSGYGTITCKTYNGSTLVGTTTCGFYAYAVKDSVSPDVSGTVVDANATTIALTGSSSKLVRYLSKPKVTITAVAKSSATIKTTQIENPVGLVATTSPYTFNTVYSPEFRFKATDSRGYSTTTKVTVGTFIEYDPCYFSKDPTVKRTESTSTTATATMSGYCFKGSFGSVSNTLAVKYRYKTSGGSYGSYKTVTTTWNTDGSFTATASITGLSLNEAYIIEFVVQDKLTSFPATVTLGKGIGDIRITKDNIQFKNSLFIGDSNNTAWKCTKVMRKVNNVLYEGQFGVDNTNNEGVTVMDLYKADVMKGRMELRSDGHLYNYLSNMSLAEIMASAPSTVGGGAQGYCLLNGGSSSPILMQWGRVNITPTAANTATSVPIYFNFEYSGLPFVCCDKATSAPSTVFANVGDVTSSSFALYIQRPSVVATSVLWFAIGNGTNALPE